MKAYLIKVLTAMPPCGLFLFILEVTFGATFRLKTVRHYLK